MKKKYDRSSIRKVYEGKITTVSDTQIVVVNGSPLDFRLDIVEYSTTGLSWGYSGAGPIQLAVALLADAFDAEFAGKYAGLLKDWINQLDQEQPWVIHEYDLVTIIYNAAEVDKHTEITEALSPFGI